MPRGFFCYPIWCHGCIDIWSAGRGSHTTKVGVPESDNDLGEREGSDGREYGPEKTRDGGVCGTRSMPRNNEPRPHLERSKRLVPREIKVYKGRPGCEIVGWRWCSFQMQSLTTGISRIQPQCFQRPRASPYEEPHVFHIENVHITEPDSPK